MQNSDSWDPPSFVLRIRNPKVGEEWLARIRAWEDANKEISKAWAEALMEESERREMVREREFMLASLRAAGISDRAVASFALGLERTPATEAVTTFLGSGRTFLLLMGSAGSGKTQATALALANGGGLFVRALELARLSAYDKADRERMERVHRARTLVIDDLGAELLHNAWLPMLDELIDIRWGERRQTIITTNLDSAAFKQRYGARISDRIRDDGFIEKCGDKSRRGSA